MKYLNFIIIVFITALSFTAINCSKDSSKKDNSTDKSKVTDTLKTPGVNVEEIVTKISTFRAAG